MKAVIQRVKRGSVSVDGRVLAEIGPGLVVLLGVAAGDDASDVAYIADKIAHLRIFGNAENKMDLSVRDTGGEVLVISQFTLLGDCRRGRRPNFIEAALPAEAQQRYREVIEELKKYDLVVQEGKFQKMMVVEIINDGPVTIILDSKK